MDINLSNLEVLMSPPGLQSSLKLPRMQRNLKLQKIVQDFILISSDLKVNLFATIRSNFYEM